MKKNHKIGFAFISLFISACNPIFYAPTIAPTPLFKKKGETQLVAQIDDRKDVFQLHGAHACDSSLAFFGSFYAGKRERESVLKDIFNYKYNAGLQIEGAFGYFKPIKKKGVWEMYGGTALGKINGHGGVKSNFIKPFAQFNIGYRSKIVDVAFSTRLSFLHIGIKNDNANDYPELKIVKANPNSFLFEPGLTVRLGYEPVKFQAHVGMSFNHRGGNYPQENGGLTVGLVWMLNSAFKKPKKTSM